MAEIITYNYAVRFQDRAGHTHTLPDRFAWWQDARAARDATFRGTPTVKRAWVEELANGRTTRRVGIVMVKGRCPPWLQPGTRA